MEGHPRQGQRQHPCLSQSSSEPAALPSRNSIPAPSRAAQNGLPTRTCVLRPARAPRRRASLRSGPAGSRPTRHPRLGRSVPARPGTPFPSVPRRRPRPALPTSLPPGLTQQQQEQRPPGSGGRHGATQPRPEDGGCASGEAGGRARPPTREARQLRARHGEDPAAGSACHVSTAAPAGHVSRGSRESAPGCRLPLTSSGVSTPHVMLSRAARGHVVSSPRDASPSGLSPPSILK